MSDASNAARSLRERLGAGTEDRLGRALSDLLENPLLSGAIGRAFDAREKAAQAQELALAALNLPSAADIERLTRRLRSVSLRLEGIEEALDRLDRALPLAGAERSQLDGRLAAVEARLERLADAVGRIGRPAGQTPRSAAAKAGGGGKAAGKAKAEGAAKAKVEGAAKAKAKGAAGARRTRTGPRKA
ncbi:MAG TPA: hypothetical protein VL979_13825 [Solirubrobacteraceae bacterium]|nr:hypothetical protein [Solirubrobacteraceae bacterium]